MKILNAQQIKFADQCSIEKQQITSWQLMERAAKIFTDELLEHIQIIHPVHIYCGKGNNGGDGLVIARLLSLKAFKVTAIIVEYSNKATEDFLLNYNKLKALSNLKIIHIKSKDDWQKFEIQNEDVCVDALLGSGVNKAAEGFLKEAIVFINQNYKEIFSVDVPSGIFLDKMNDFEDAVIHAHRTFTFQFPKLSFLFPENAKYVGNWKVLDIGLSKECIESQNTNFYTFDKKRIKEIYRPRNDISSKWDYGHCLIIAGSNNMRGAAMLCAGAALRSGCGLLTVHSIENVVSEVIQKYPECLLSIDAGVTECENLPELEKYNAIAIGCGMGKSRSAFSVLKDLLSNNNQKKIVIDADALNVMAEHPELIYLIKNQSVIITPHIKEFDRMFGKSQHHFERIQKAIQIAEEFNIVIVLKSAYNTVILPDGKVYFNTLANSAMAKGGSGDVLTGIIVSLCAKAYSIEHAALFAVYIHSLAGYFAKKQIHSESVLPSDVILNISSAFKYLDDD